MTLGRFSESEVARTEKPIKFVLPFATIFAQYFAEKLQDLTSEYERKVDLLSDDHDHFEKLGYSSLMRRIRILLKDVRFCLRSLSLLEDIAPTQSSIRDFKSLLDRAVELQEMIRDGLNVEVAAQSLEASRQSIRESKKVNSLTLPAWVFIPVSLIASVFGMNVVELSGQGPRLWLFFAISAPVIIVAVVLEWWFVRSSGKRKVT